MQKLTVEAYVAEQLAYLNRFARSADEYTARLAREAIAHLATEYPDAVAKVIGPKAAALARPTATKPVVAKPEAKQAMTPTVARRAATPAPGAPRPARRHLPIIPTGRRRK
jgi:hypothetical protein